MTEDPGRERAAAEHLPILGRHDPSIDKSTWGDGPWQTEPDQALWRDPDTGLHCQIRRHPRHGHLCGYVAVPEGHPMHGAGYDEVPVEAHGGLTFAGRMDGPEWWVGFDCLHAFDIGPSMVTREREYGFPFDPPGEHTVYRTWGYVVDETTALALQLRNLDL